VPYLLLLLLFLNNTATSQFSTLSLHDALPILVNSYPGKGDKTWKQLVEIRSVYSEAGWRKASGKVILYLDREGYDEPFAYGALRSEEHTSELQSRENLVCRLLLEK